MAYKSSFEYISISSCVIYGKVLLNIGQVFFVACVVSSSESCFECLPKILLSLSVFKDFPKILNSSLFLLFLAGLECLFLDDSVFVNWKSNRLLFFVFYFNYPKNNFNSVLSISWWHL